MKLLNKNTDYALRALATLASAGSDKMLSSAEISSAQHIPLQFLRRILHTLVEGGYITAQEGKFGGVKLDKPAYKITVAEIIRLFQGPLELSECMFRRKLCHNRATCVLRHKIKAIEMSVALQFEGITVQSLLDDINKGE
jgi:Rrf2 family protein